MMDVEFLTELRRWARESVAEFEQLFRATGPTADSGLVNASYRRYNALSAVLDARLAAERARLVAAVEEEQDGPGEVAARRAMANFDAATKGGE